MSGQIAAGSLRGSAWPPRLVLGASVVSAIVALAIIGPSIAPYDPTSFAVRVRLMPPSATHWFGTDEFGRDVLSRVLSGAHYSLAIGFGATGICLVIGVSLGLAAAFHRRVVEAAIMRTVDLLISIPPILLGLLILAVTTPSLWKTIVAVGLIYIPITDAADAIGGTRPAAGGLRSGRARARRGPDARFCYARSCRMPGRLIIVEAGLRITFAILLGSSLSFLGLGPQPPSSEWGLMIAESRQFIDQAPWIGLAPGLSLCVVLVAVNLFGEGLREALDPQLQE